MARQIRCRQPTVSTAVKSSDGEPTVPLAAGNIDSA
jgi:hypothetical protein